MNNIRETYQFLNEIVNNQTAEANLGSLKKKATKLQYKFGDFYPSPMDPIGIVVIEEGYHGQPMTIMSLTSFKADGTTSYEEERLTWAEAMQGAKLYDCDGKTKPGEWELPSVEQFKIAFDIQENGDNDEAIRKIEYINEQIDKLNRGEL